MIDSLLGVPLLESGQNAPDDRPVIVGGSSGEHILVPLVDPTIPVVTDQIGVATTLAKTTGASLQVTTPGTSPEQPAVEFGEELTTETEHDLLQWAVSRANSISTNGRGRFLSTRRSANGIHRLIDTNPIDTLILPSTANEGLVGRTVTDRLVSSAKCDVIVVNGKPGYHDAVSILLPIAGGPHSGLAADTAQKIAESSDAWIDILHVIDDDPTPQQHEVAEDIVTAAYQRIARPETSTTWILEATDTTDAIIEQSQYYGLTIIGAPTTGRLHRFVYGSTNQSIRADANSVVLSTRNHGDTTALLAT